jgi:hypothetical protein
MPCFPRVSPQAHPHHQRARATKPGDKATQQGGEDLPQREVLPARLVTALAVEQSEEWISGRRYLDMGELEGHRPEQKRDVEGVIAHATLR